MTYPFPNFNGSSLGMEKSFHPTVYWICDYISNSELKLNHVSKWGLMEISLHSYPNCKEFIAKPFCLWHDSREFE